MSKWKEQYAGLWLWTLIILTLSLAFAIGIRP